MSEKVDLLHHIVDSHSIEIFSWKLDLPHIEIFGIDMSITKHVFFMWIAAAVMTSIFIIITRKEHMVPRGLRNLFEAMAVFIRDFVAKPYLKEDTDRFLPYIWTVFFFIMFCNLMGLIPFGATPTGNIAVTGTLALCTLVLCQVTAIIRHGKHYLHALVPPVQWWLWPMMFVIEVSGWMAKTMALAIRLFANMVGGHIVLLGFLSLTFIFKSYAVGTASVAVCTALYCLEIFVALLQAFVFTFLTAVFLGIMLHPDH
ncbi:MAG: ATP synthase F0 subunit A [Planctomycetota bacterium]|nr:MAG: ATP synthase F0 subunit A [Planctomycetota bacterium]